MRFIHLPHMPRAARLFLALLVGAAVLAACASNPRKEGLSERQIAVLKEQGFKLTEDGWAFGMSSKILFGNDEDKISDESRPVIFHISRALLDAEIDSVRLEGHTDSQGAADYNQRLSVRRAEAVAQVFIEAGMPKANVRAMGMGMSKPVADNQTAVGRLENRRVTIIVPVE